MHVVRGVILTAACTLGPISAWAQNCAGFTDVPGDSPSCDSIQWVKNRGVTVGCRAGMYCPLDSTLRDQMAAFMNRLGRVLTPEILYAQGDTGAISLPGESPTPPAMTCITTDIIAQVAPAQYARQASVTAVLSGLGDGTPSSWRAFVQVSTDGGSTWSDMNPGTSVGMRTTSSANGWASSSVTEHMDLAPGTAYRFAIGVRRDNVVASAGNLAAGRCQIAATVVNRNPATPPF